MNTGEKKTTARLRQPHSENVIWFISSFLKNMELNMEGLL